MLVRLQFSQKLQHRWEEASEVHSLVTHRHQIKLLAGQYS